MKLLFNQDFIKKIEDCEDVSDHYDMLIYFMKQLTNIYPGSL